MRFTLKLFVGLCAVVVFASGAWGCQTAELAGVDDRPNAVVIRTDAPAEMGEW